MNYNKEVMIKEEKIVDETEYQRIVETYLDDVYRTVLACCKNKENA